MKLTKLISTIFTTTTVAISTLSFFSVSSAMAAHVHVVRHCETYNNEGNPVGALKPGYYYLVKYVRFERSGLHGSQVTADFTSSGKGIGTVNIANRCLQSSERRVIEFN